MEKKLIRVEKSLIIPATKTAIESQTLEIVTPKIIQATYEAVFKQLGPLKA